LGGRKGRGRGGQGGAVIALIAVAGGSRAVVRAKDGRRLFYKQCPECLDWYHGQRRQVCCSRFCGDIRRARNPKVAAALAAGRRAMVQKKRARLAARLAGARTRAEIYDLGFSAGYKAGQRAAMKGAKGEIHDRR
jgi:hypothetical protein